jgi:hypothetical protein
VKKNLSAEQFTTVRDLLNNAIANRSIHIENRVMGSAVISIIEGERAQSYLLKGDAREIKEVETFLRGLLK